MRPDHPEPLLDARLFATFTRDTADWVAIVSPAGDIHLCSAASGALLGYAPERLIGRSGLDGVIADDRDRVALIFRETRLRNLSFQVEYGRLDREGRIVRIQTVVRCLDRDRWPDWLVLTSRLAAPAPLEIRRRLHDRGFFLARLQEAIECAAVDPQYRFAVIALEIQQQELVDGATGAQEADQLVTEAGLRLKRHLGPRDAVTRSAENELAVLVECPGVNPDPDAVVAYCQRGFEAAFQVGEHEVQVSTVMGVVLSKPSYRRADQVMADARAAKRSAQRIGRGGPASEVFDTDMGRANKRRFRLAVDLPQAVEQDALYVAYQPLIDLAGGHVVGVEALARWQHAALGSISPAEFIPFAEEIGQISALDRWVLRRACDEFQTLPGAEALFLSVNLSARQLARDDLVGAIGRILWDSGLPAERLHLELTESAVAEDARVARAQLAALKELGIQIALDDFGTGYSSFAYLAELPLDMLKIDRSFVARMHLDGAIGGIVHGVIALARRLGLQVLAEGIEVEEQMNLLRQLECDLGQGFFFSKPVQIDGLRALLEGGAEWPPPLLTGQTTPWAF